MDINELRAKAMSEAPKVLECIFMCSDFDFLNKLEVVKFRVKSEESILKKCKKLNLDAENCYDLLGIRFILKNQDDCYELCEAIKNNKKLEFIEIRDYIKTPQNNGPYRALHILIRFEEIPCEIQLLSQEMYELVKGRHSDYKSGKFD